MMLLPNTHMVPTPQQALVRHPSKFIQNYVVDYDSPLGKGNFSTVYKAHRVSEPGNPLAMKLVNIASLREQKIDNLIRAEIDLLKTTSHKNVIACRDVFCDDTFAYIFTDFYEGGSLETLVKKGRHSEAEMLPIVKDIFDGLKYLETCKIIHRDIKSANIFMKQGRAVVADLGFAKFFTQPFYDLQIGSPPFMPPEALNKGYYCNKTDVWAFGALVYEIYHGESPFQKCMDYNELLRAVATPLTVYNLRADLSIEMKTLILSCLDIDIDKRPKFCEMEESWYFKKLFAPIQNFQSFSKCPPSPSASPLKSIVEHRTPLKNIHVSVNRSRLNATFHTPGDRKLFRNEEERVSPAFNRINQFKSDLKKKIDQNVTLSYTLIEHPRTPKQSVIQHSAKFIANSQSIQNSAIRDTEASRNTSVHRIVERVPLKQALKIIKNVRNYYILAKTLKSVDPKIHEIKNRLIKFSLGKVNQIEDKIKHGQITMSEKENQNHTSKLSKFSLLVHDYKIELEKELPLSATSTPTHSRILSTLEQSLPSDLDYITRTQLTSADPAYRSQLQQCLSKLDIPQALTPTKSQPCLHRLLQRPVTPNITPSTPMNKTGNDRPISSFLNATVGGTVGGMGDGLKLRRRVTEQAHYLRNVAMNLYGDENRTHQFYV